MSSGRSVARRTATRDTMQRTALQSTKRYMILCDKKNNCYIIFSYSILHCSRASRRKGVDSALGPESVENPKLLLEETRSRTSRRACTHTYYIYIYIYVCTGRERERERDYICYVCVYIYIYVCVDIDIHTYTHYMLQALRHLRCAIRRRICLLAFRQRPLLRRLAASAKRAACLRSAVRANGVSCCPDVDPGIAQTLVLSMHRESGERLRRPCAIS